MRRLAQATGASVALVAVLVWSWSGSAGTASGSAVSAGPVASVSAPGGSFLRDAMAAWSSCTG
jgi:hypothetical protein